MNFFWCKKNGDRGGKWYLRCTLITVKSGREISEGIEGISFIHLPKLSQSTMWKVHNFITSMAHLWENGIDEVWNSSLYVWTSKWMTNHRL